MTTEELRDLVVDRLIQNIDLFVPPGPNEVDRFRQIVNVMNSLAMDIATKAIVNRQNLSPMPVFDGEIPANPDADVSGERYELRYRIIECVGDNPPHKDETFSFDEAVETFGEDFVERYWGRLGEHCPRSVSRAGDRTLWFTAVRYPVASMTNEIGQRENQSSPNHKR